MNIPNAGLSRNRAESIDSSHSFISNLILGRHHGLLDCFLMSQYEKRGASADKRDVHRALDGLDPGVFPGAFCKLVPDCLVGNPAYCLALHADGAGTKSAVAYLHYKQTRDSSVFRGIAQDSLVMNLDDLLCIGALGPFVLSNTIGRNAKLIPGEIIREIVAGYEECISKFGELGITITSCGGETADLGDLVRTVIVDSTLAARVPRQDVINCANVVPGHVIVGLASFGQASYESAANSGIGTNGFTTARHVLLSKRYAEKFQETFAPEITSLAYQGRFELSDTMDSGISIGDALLSPTRTYAPIVKTVLAETRSSISAIFHNSGGGLSKCLRFGNSVHYIKDNLFPTPPIFSLIRSEGSLAFTEMCRTFNLGHRLELVCEESAAARICAIAESFSVPARIVGRVERSDDANRVTISHEGESAEFSFVE